MIVALIIIAIIFLLFLVIWFTTVSILIDFSHRQDDDHLIIQLIIWKVIRYKIKVPKIKVEQDEPTITFKRKQIQEQMSTVKLLLKKFQIS